MTPAQEYEQYIKQARQLQLANNADAVRSLDALLAKTANELRWDILNTPPGLRSGRYKRDITAHIDNAVDQLRDKYKPLLDDHITRAAQIVAGRERDLLENMLNGRADLRADHRLGVSASGANLAVQFGRVPLTVMERAYSRTYADGLKLSQRLYNMDKDARKAIAETVFQGIATGQSAKSLADSIVPHLTQTGVENVRYNAMRIARTEISTAYREGHIASVTDPKTGRLLPYIEAIGWRLSPSHPRIDICDIWASQDNGFGPGNYQPEDVPPGHPHCLCACVSILASDPSMQFVSKAPRPEDVPESQRRYYGVSDSPSGRGPDTSKPSVSANEGKSIHAVDTSAPAIVSSRSTQATNSVSDYIEVQKGSKRPNEEFEKTEAYMRLGLDEISKVHNVPEMPKVPAKPSYIRRMGNNLGIYDPDPRSRNIKVAADGAWPVITMVHETGHAIDDLLLARKNEDMASVSSPELEVWRKAVKASDAIKKLRNAYNSGQIQSPYDKNQTAPTDKKHAKYLLEDFEIFARSYAQYIAENSKNRVLLEQWEKFKSNGQNISYNKFWEEDDFKPIRAAFDALLEERGWLKGHN